ncbi:MULTISPECIES: DUF6597 domain-containing transcriptional factor [Kocuria]|uniref:DUF6597 domain-containing transcriptional factor n=1 Tax=Kocuria TaxID=57493 RepID=UPI0008C01C2F|nr:MULTISPECIES: DUF6597 domain-containing transcriptional factor [Kocuria]OFK08152.1 hypothetical protein HMPREF2833_02025 [Kocuria sp. HMSC066H03]
MLWRVEADAGDMRIVPDGVMDLMWSGGRFLFAGADTTAMISSSETGGVTWGLRLSPGQAHVLLDIPARELADQRFDLSDLISVPAPLIDAAHGDPGAALEALLVTFWEKTPPQPAALRLAASLDGAARQGVTVSGMAERHGLSERGLRRVCDRVFGYGPKTLGSIDSSTPFISSVRAPRSARPPRWPGTWTNVI